MNASDQTLRLSWNDFSPSGTIFSIRSGAVDGPGRSPLLYDRVELPYSLSRAPVDLQTPTMAEKYTRNAGCGQGSRGPMSAEPRKWKCGTEGDEGRGGGRIGFTAEEAIGFAF